MAKDVNSFHCHFFVFVEIRRHDVIMALNWHHKHAEIINDVIGIIKPSLYCLYFWNSFHFRKSKENTRSHACSATKTRSTATTTTTTMASHSSKVPLHYSNIDTWTGKCDRGLNTPIWQHQEGHRNYGTCSSYGERKDFVSDFEEEKGKLSRIQKILDVQNLRNLLRSWEICWYMLKNVLISWKFDVK